MSTTLRKRSRNEDSRNVTQERRHSRAVSMVQFLDEEYGCCCDGTFAPINREFTPGDVNNLSCKIACQVDNFQGTGDDTFRLYLWV